MGIFFDDSRPRVSVEEYKKHVRGALASRGFSHRELGVMDIIFNAALYEKSSREHGIDTQEIEQAVKFLRDNRSKYGISPERINIIEQVLKKYL